jgi:hypothetical protein
MVETSLSWKQFSNLLNSMFPKYGVQNVFELKSGCMLGHRLWNMKSLEQWNIEIPVQ